MELCNGLDDDCDALTDETFALDTDDLNCGVCGRACPGGAGCRLGACREINCADGIDNDADGGADCADRACQGLTCFTTTDAGYVCGTFPDAGADAGDPDAGDPDAGDLDAGAPDAGPSDAGPPDAGFFCFPAEMCDDGMDNDQDNLTDCADPDCNTRMCFSGAVCTNGVCPGPG